MSSFRRRYFLFCAALTAAIGFAATPARAGGNVQWSISIGAPWVPGPVGAVISNARYGYYAPPYPIYLPPQPIYLPPAPVYVRARRPYYMPVPVYYGPPGLPRYHGAPVLVRDWRPRGHGHRFEHHRHARWRH